MVHTPRTPPDDAAGVSETLKYLEACSLLFEKGFLSHNKAESLNCEVLQNIENGYKYFSDWISAILQKGGNAYLIMAFYL